MLIRCAALVLALAGVCAFADEPQVKRLWEWRATDSGPVHDLQALRFSWDGKFIAAVAVHLRTEDSPANELLVIPADGRVADIRRFLIREELLSTPRHAGIHWSPTGEFIAAETKHFSTIIVHVPDGGQCMLPRTTVFGGFVGPDRVIAADWEPPRDPALTPANLTTMTVYDTRCNKVESWRVRGQVRDIEPYAPGSVLAVRPEQAGVQVMSMPGRKELGALPESIGSMVRFGEKGNVLCKGDLPGRGTLACYDLRAGRRIGHPTLTGGAPLDVSAESSIVVAADSLNAIGLDPSRFHIRRWILWDFRSEREIGRLKYAQPKHGFEASPAAISPDGRRVATGDGDLLQFYEIQRP